MPDSILDALDEVQGRKRHAPRMPTVPPSRMDGMADVFRGHKFTKPQIEQFASELQLDYGTTRQGVIDRGGQVEDTGGDDSILSVLAEVQGASADRRSTFAKAFDAIFTAPEFVTDAFKRGADRIDAPSLDRSPARARLDGFAAGAWEGFGNLLSPGDIVLTALGFSPVARAARGVRGGVEAIGALQRGANVATVARGVERIADADAASEGAAGVAQAAFGGIGALAPVGRPQAASRPRAALPAGASFVAAPDGRVAPAGTDIPMTPAADGSFVRAVPAQYGQRVIRGELPPGPRFTADAAGHVAPVERADELLALLDEVQGRRGPDPSGVVSTRPAVLEREIDPLVPARQGARVRQYASDPNAVDVPFLDAEDVQLLQRAGEDLATFTPQRGRLITDPNDPASSVYAHGGRGSEIAEDVRVISEQNVSNAEIEAARRHLVAGGQPTNRLHTAWLDWARGVRAGDAGYHKPVVPDASRGGEAAAVDDFERFASIFDDVEPGVRGGGREPGEEGFITAQLATHVGGGVAGAAAGAASGEDTGDSLKRGLLFGALGAAAPALLRRSGVASAAGRAADGFTNRPRLVVDARPREAVPPRSGRSGAPMADPMRGMEPFFAKFSNPLVRDGVERLVTENNGYAVQRRGTIENSTLARFASEVRVNVSRSLPKGTALNAESVTAYARALQETQQKVNELAQRVSAGDDSAGTLLALQAARAEADVVGRSLLGARSEAGRALAAFNFYRGILDTGDVRLIRDTLNAPGLRDEAERLARGLADQPNDPLARYLWLQQQSSTSLMDKVRGYYYANILSGVKTHERNIMGNLANVVTNLAVHPFAAGVDALKAVTRGTPRTLSLDELPSQVVGAVAGFERGIHDFAFTMRHGVSPDALSRALHAGELGKLDVPRVEFKGGAANPFNIPGRLLDAADSLFRSVSRNQELYGLAHTQAKQEGLTGQRFLDRVAELRAGTTPEAVTLRQQADTFATRAVFQEKPGAFASLLQQGAHKFPMLSFVIPFIKTPANITRQGLEFSPAGALMKAARQEGRAGAQAQARVVAGTMAAGALAYYAATGRLSGDGPKDREKRAALMESGWRPNSVRLGNKWVSYQLFQPVSVQAAIIANAFEAWAENGAKPADAADIVASTLARSANSFLDQSFMSGLFDFVEALKDPERSASRFAGRLASGAVPLSGAVRTVQQGMDPVVRAPKSVAENVASGLPRLSEQMPARIDRFGEVVTREGGAARRAADPFNISSVTNDPVARELDRLGLEVALPDADLKGIDLTRPQQQALQQARGRAVRQAIERVMRERRYSGSSDVARMAFLEHAIGRARRQVTEQAKRELAAVP